MDIRKYFGAATAVSSKQVSPSRKNSRNEKSKKAVVYLSESDDEDPIPTKIRKRPSKLAVLASDSDSEESVVNSLKKKVKSTTNKRKSPMTRSKSSVVTKTDRSKSSDGKKLKKERPTTVDDFFGVDPLVRKEKSSSKRQRVCDDVVKQKNEKHKDDDFNETLEQIDVNERSCKKARIEKNEHPVKVHSEAGTSTRRTSPRKKPTSESNAVDRNTVKETKNSSGLAGKLASKIKTAKPQKATESPVKRKSETDENDNEKPLQRSASKTPEKSKEVADDRKNVVDSEKKRNYLNYQKYLHRQGPKAAGSKEIPKGADNCLEGLTFIITGVLESLEREEAKSLVERYGGKVTSNVSRNTSYVVFGDDAGPSKMEKAEKLGTKQLDENGLLELIRTLPGKRSKYEIMADDEEQRGKSTKRKSKSGPSSNKVVKAEPRVPEIPELSSLPKKSEDSNMWVDKYRPTSVKQIIGQQGEKSNANKLLSWLRNWHRNNLSGADKKKPNNAMKWKDPTGGSYKAALLSGSPGVGKTTTAQLVCKEAGFSYVEMNASDTRSKKSIEEHVASLVSNESMDGYYGSKSDEREGNKHVLIMDEVDGMAGNEDRGGVQELIQLIKSSKVPVVCICNDKSLPKMRSLLNYCFDLAFQKPRLEQIKGAMMSVAYKEGLKITPPAMQEIILGANQDVRQVLHNLSMWSAREKTITYDQAKDEASKARKHIVMGPFDVVRKVFCGGDNLKTISDKSDLFFHDYSIGPLFVHENYLNVNPTKARNGDVNKHLKLMSCTADSICDGDLIERQIRTNNAWSLLPLQAIYSSIIPGECYHGYLSGMINFPVWLGKNSSRNKNDRILQELLTHLRLSVSSNKTQMNMDYLRMLRNVLSDPLIRKESGGIDEVVRTMKHYSLSREDLDLLMEVTSCFGSSNPLQSLNSKLKAAFTRAYHKELIMKPYSVVTAPKKGRGGATTAADGSPLVEDEENIVEDVSDDNADDVSNDAMIKVKKSKKLATSKSKTKSVDGSKSAKVKSKKK